MYYGHRFQKVNTVDLETLKIFDAVAAELSITRAASKLGRVPSNIALRPGRGDDRTVWGIDLKRVAQSTPLAVGDTVALEFLGRQAVVVKQPVRNDQGHVVDHRKVSTHRYSWKAHILPV